MKKYTPHACAFIFGLILSVFITTAWVAAQEEAPAVATEQTIDAHDTTLTGLFQTGGWMMWPILFCLFAVLGLIVYHILELRVTKLAPEKDLDALRKHMYDHDIKSAYTYCEENPSLMTQSFAAGVLRLNESAPDKGKTSAEAAIAEKMDNQETRMGFWLNLISVIAAISPMLGLLGTVSGMIKAFNKIGMGGMGKPEELAGNIGEAMITTASGLIVGIPAMLAFFIFRGRLDALLTRVAEAETELIDIYTGEGVARARYEIRSGQNTASSQ